MHDKKSKVIQIISIILCLSLLAGVSASDINTDWIDVNKVDSKKIKWALILSDNMKETIFLANRSKTAHR